jgi:hypothetical protein
MGSQRRPYPERSQAARLAALQDLATAPLQHAKCSRGQAAPPGETAAEARKALAEVYGLLTAIAGRDEKAAAEGKTVAGDREEKQDAEGNS